MQIKRRQWIAGKSNRQVVREVLESGDSLTAEEICTRLADSKRLSFTPEPVSIIKAIADLTNKDGVTFEKTPAGGKRRYYKLVSSVEQIKRTRPTHGGELTVSQKMVEACFHLVQSKPGAQITPDMIADWYELSDEKAMVLFNSVVKVYGDQLRVHRSITLR